MTAVLLLSWDQHVLLTGPLDIHSLPTREMRIERLARIVILASLRLVFGFVANSLARKPERAGAAAPVLKAGESV
jgi:hypothetical protein|tara:strand:- start:281 stop:505 length:225 start_codon:yes stop_codon:yes gene_type:complete